MQEGDLGTLEVGKRADITVVNADLERAPADALRLAKVTATFVDGERVH
jgi:predicted amidohydrolase YtcJ